MEEVEEGDESKKVKEKWKKQEKGGGEMRTYRGVMKRKRSRGGEWAGILG